MASHWIRHAHDQKARSGKCTGFCRCCAHGLWPIVCSPKRCCAHKEEQVKHWGQGSRADEGRALGPQGSRVGKGRALGPQGNRVDEGRALGPGQSCGRRPSIGATGQFVWAKAEHWDHRAVVWAKAKHWGHRAVVWAKAKHWGHRAIVWTKAEHWGHGAVVWMKAKHWGHRAIMRRRRLSSRVRAHLVWTCHAAINLLWRRRCLCPAWPLSKGGDRLQVLRRAAGRCPCPCTVPPSCEQLPTAHVLRCADLGGQLRQRGPPV